MYDAILVVLRIRMAEWQMARDEARRIRVGHFVITHRLRVPRLNAWRVTRELLPTIGCVLHPYTALSPPVVFCVPLA